MKRFFPLAAALMLTLSFAGYGQRKIVDDNYKRSSLCIIFIDETDMPNRELIKSIVMESPVPDKYNDHNPAGLNRCFNASRYTITKEDKDLYRAAMQTALDAEAEETGSAKPKKARMGGLGATMRGLGSLGMQLATGQEGSAMFDETNLTDFGVKALKYMNEKNVAKHLFDRWFIDENGNFTDQVMIDRGQYGATMADVRMAANSVYGTRLLNSAGEELINNTFVVVSRFRYINKDDVAKEINAVGEEKGSKSTAEDAAWVKAFTGEGYYVRVTSFLFQLDWNEEIQGLLYDMWDDMARYNASDIFKLKYVGQETAFANVKQSTFAKSRPVEELIAIATINAQDAALAKLEKKYDVFKTKTPLLSVEPQIYAEVGLKEGISAGDKYEVLEKLVEEETGKVSYKRKGVLKVAADGIWDNRFGADVMAGQAIDQSQPQATLFEKVSGGDLYPGMLIRQIK